MGLTTTYADLKAKANLEFKLSIISRVFMLARQGIVHVATMVASNGNAHPTTGLATYNPPEDFVNFFLNTLSPMTHQKILDTELIVFGIFVDTKELNGPFNSPRNLQRQQEVK